MGRSSAGARCASTIHDEICAQASTPSSDRFMQAYGSKRARREPAAACPARRLPPDRRPRVRGTIAAIEATLLRDGFVHRYDSGVTDDGLPPGEGAFLACTFWLADNYVLLGRHDEARALFERLLALRNDVGLLAEEYDPQAQRQVGNFPQAFSHVALVTTPRTISRAPQTGRTARRGKCEAARELALLLRSAPAARVSKDGKGMCVCHIPSRRRCAAPQDEVLLLHQLVFPALLECAVIRRAGVNAFEKCHRFGGLPAPSPLAGGQPLPGGKLIWMSAAVNSLPANHSLFPSSLSQDVAIRRLSCRIDQESGQTPDSRPCDTLASLKTAPAHAVGISVEQAASATAAASRIPSA